MSGTLAAPILPGSPQLGDDLRMEGRIYSVGYEGMTLEGLVSRLSDARVSVLVDVRLNPVSRKPGFSRRRLAEACDSAGIEYVHEKELGNPPDNRDSFRKGDGEEGRVRMRSILSNGAGAALERIVQLASAKRIAVLCVERDHGRCHRGVITDMAVERNAKIEIVHIL
jgi:uncharacterized protein (DUF488 family)